MSAPQHCHGYQNYNVDGGAGCLGTADATVNCRTGKNVLSFTNAIYQY